MTEMLNARQLEYAKAVEAEAARRGVHVRVDLDIPTFPGGDGETVEPMRNAIHVTTTGKGRAERHVIVGDSPYSAFAATVDEMYGTAYAGSSTQARQDAAAAAVEYMFR